MPSGVGAVNVRNVPSQKYRIDPAYFDHFTERNIYSPYSGDPVPTNPPASGSSAKLHRTFDKVGIVPRARSLVSANVVVTHGTGTDASTYRYPWSMFYYQVSGNGSTDFISVDGMFLYLRKIVENPGWRPNTARYATTFGTTGTYPIQLFFDIPIAMDMMSLTGSLYAQARGTSIAVDMIPNPTSTWATITGNDTVVVTTNNGVTLETDFYSVPYDQSKDEIVVPDVELLHGFTDNTQNTAGASKQDVDLEPFVGQLERLYFWWDNNGALVPSSAYTMVQFRYGGTQQPLTWTGPQLREKIEEETRSDPNVPVIPDGMFVLDFIRWSPARDVILMDGVTSPRLHLETSGVSWSGTNTLYYAVETLFV